MRPAVSIILDKRRMSTTGDNKGKFPIKIKVNFKVRHGKKNRYVVRRFPTGIFCKVGEFGKKKNESTIILALSKAMELHKKGLSVSEFERLYTGSGGLEDIETTFEYAITRLREEGRDGTAEAYTQAYRSFEKYKGEFISFGSITVEWLKAYERWMVRDRTEGEETIPGRSINTVGMYCRALRTIFNLAIELNIIGRDVFPFGVRKYVIPSSPRLAKKAFTKEQKNAILLYRSENKEVNRALDFWAYQFFSSGCNMADVAYLKWKDIAGDSLAFERKKTENTERYKLRIKVYINERMREVIHRHGNKSLDPNAYVFPILKPGMSSKQRKETIKDFLKDINKLLAMAQQEMKLPIKLTTGTARYTAATLLKRDGIDLQVIAKALGHGSEATTEKYTEEENETLMLISKTLAT